MGKTFDFGRFAKDADPTSVYDCVEFEIWSRTTASTRRGMLERVHGNYLTALRQAQKYADRFGRTVDLFGLAGRNGTYDKPVLPTGS